MRADTVPPRETGSLLLLAGGLAAAMLATTGAPGPGPLAACTAVVVFHASLVAPTLACKGPLWGFLPLGIAAPALLTTSFGHEGTLPVAASLLLAACACASGAAARALGLRAGGYLYLPTMLLLLLAPPALGYLAAEFGRADVAGSWRMLSPLAAALALGSGGGLPFAGLAGLLVWPVWSLARSRA